MDRKPTWIKMVVSENRCGIKTLHYTLDENLIRNSRILFYQLTNPGILI